MKLGERWFGVLLQFFPPPFREVHGDDMRHAFVPAWAEHRAAGLLSLGTFLARTSLDMTVSGLRERLASRNRMHVTTPGPHTGSGGGLVSWLDVKLGVRMLVKHPGLAIVSVLALAVGIPVGVAPSHFVDAVMAPLPVPQGEDIRALRVWSPALGRSAQSTAHDLEAWRQGLSTFEDVAAFQEGLHNVDPGEGSGTTVRAAAVTASAFRLLRVQPLLGRALQPADEIPGAPQVVVVGFDLWQSRYAADPSLVGKSIRLGDTPHTVVGVMPEGFLFPEHQNLWTPLRVPAGQQAQSDVRVVIFGRLAAGATDKEALAEFTLVARRSSLPGSDPRARPEVAAFATTALPGLSGGLRSTPEYFGFQSLALIVLLVACVNVGMLIFARTANRADELAVRTALGASRARIVTQVFTECLVLAVLATGVGLFAVMLGLDLLWRITEAQMPSLFPYWIDWSITPRTALQALSLAAVSAVLAGVIPALRFTGGAVQSTIQRARARRTGVRFGGLSGALIVLDVAVAVTAVGFAASAADQARSTGVSDEAVGIAADEYLAVSVRLPSESRATAQEELVRRLKAEREVRAVAVADYLPRMEHRTRRVEAEGVQLPDGRPGISARVARVDLDYFRELGQPVLAGREFVVGDLEADRSAVMVNRTFVERVLGGQNAIGRRLRFRPWGDGEPGPWLEIVGVVDHLGMRALSAENDQGVYLPFAPGDLETVRFAIHMGENPSSFATRFRALTAEVAPDAIATIVGPLDQVYEGDWYILIAASLGAVLLVGVLLALAASGIYAIMSFAVAERTTEIGIRAALGAGRQEIVRSVARRAAAQLTLGVALGMPLSAIFMSSGDRTGYEGLASALFMGGLVMIGVGLAACTGPTLRALRIHPSEALREG